MLLMFGMVGPPLTGIQEPLTGLQQGNVDTSKDPNMGLRFTFCFAL